MAFLVALLDGAALGLLDLARVLNKFGGPRDGAEILHLAFYATALGVGGALLVTLPAALLLRFGPAALRPADPWAALHGVWIGANAGLLVLWKRFAAVHESGGDYGFVPGDVLLAVAVAVIAGVLFGPALARIWRLVGRALRFPMRRFGPGRVGVGATAAVALLAFGALGGPVREAPAGTAWANGRKNVVLVIGDAMRPDHMSVYGYGPPTTPNLDRLAAHGVIAKRHFAQASYTIPSFATIITSRNPAAHGVTDYGSVLRGEFVTLAEAFRQAGYETAAFSATQLIGREFGFAQGFDTYRILRDYRGDLLYGKVLTVTGILPRPSRADAEFVNARVLRWLDGRHDRPFFLLIFYADPHFEYDAPPYLIRRFADPDYLRAMPVPRFLREYGNGKLRDEDSITFAKALYDAEIANVDAALGVLWQKLEEKGLAARTVLAVTSDHGEQFYEHGEIRHGKSLYIEEIQTPLVVADPERTVRAFVEAPTRASDLYPTLLDAAGIAPPKGIEGTSILPLAGKGPRALPRETVLMVRKENYLQGYWVDPWMLIFDRDRIRTPADRGLELYNLQEDPGEKRDLAATRSDVRDRLVAALDSRIRADAAAGPAPEKEIDRDRMQLLRELHYVK